MTKNPLPDSLIRPCKCRKACETKACHCKNSGVNCVPLCGCEIDLCANKLIDFLTGDYEEEQI